jgi:hypothetical protein
MEGGNTKKSGICIYLLFAPIVTVYLMDEIVAIANKGNGSVPIIIVACICDRCKSNCIRRCAPSKMEISIFAKVSKIENKDVRLLQKGFSLALPNKVDTYKSFL